VNGLTSAAGTSGGISLRSFSREVGPTLYVSGTVSNQGRFYSRFNAVVRLSAPADVLLRRIESRTTNDYGKTAEERGLVLSHIAEVEPLLRASCTHDHRRCGRKACRDRAGHASLMSCPPTHRSQSARATAGRLGADAKRAPKTNSNPPEQEGCCQRRHGSPQSRKALISGEKEGGEHGQNRACEAGRSPAELHAPGRESVANEVILIRRRAGLRPARPPRLSETGGRATTRSAGSARYHAKRPVALGGELAVP
jgi:hypothetical protein